MVGSIVVVRALTRCALLHSVCDLKATHSLIGEFMLSEFEVGHNVAEATQNIYWGKVKA